MDSMRGLLSGSHDQDDGAIDPPASVGVDERRMQVRAYNYWASLLADRAYPSVEDLDLEGADFGSNAVLLDFTAGVENPGIAFVGDRLRAESQIDEDVHYISQIPGRSLLSRLTDHYLQIIANRAPIGFEAEFVNDRGVTIMYRGILLPFSSDDDTIDFIMGVINWKEAAPADQAAELQLSVEQALRSAAPLTAPVPVWADGPDSEHLDDDADATPGFGALVDNSDVPIVAAREADDAFESDLDPGADAELADWLALARETAERAIAADNRSRGALYQAVAKAWDFALVAEQQPDAFAALLDDAGLAVQDRAPMTPVVKLVFGATYDKTRLAEYACVLGHAKDEGVGRGELAAYLDRYPGGLKGLVKDARARRKPERDTEPKTDDKLAALRSAHPAIILEHDAGDAEFVVLIARAMPGGHIGIVAKAADDQALIAKLAKKAVPITGG
ncbi:MAG: hypothetical protein KKA44_07565 [Alphaproteobacteria bacterium]|nr:hypothetical protein [Alphaproteobacteria bacterium]MBU0864807.1 hypothetical protein [Alphaproteobacteria bacterium]MBU1824817.1 hypothetical protein [Alphaproteobacteria bacterium]